jgi:hypothetical protein
VAASNGGRSLSSGFPNCPRPQLPASHFSKLQISTDSTITQRQSQSYVTTDGLSRRQAPIRVPRAEFYCCQKVAGLLMWGALTGERMYLSFKLLLVLASAVSSGAENLFCRPRHGSHGKRFFFIIACSLVYGETTCAQSCSLATAVVVSPVYRAVAWQWVYMS